MMHDSILHHKIESRSNANVCDRISRHGDNIGEFAGGEHAEIITTEEFGGNACGGLQLHLLALLSV
jgi:hypothetical protein